MRITYQCTINEEDNLIRYATLMLLSGVPEKKAHLECGNFFHVSAFSCEITKFQTGPKKIWHDPERSELVGEKNRTSLLHDFGLLPSKESDMFNLIIRATQISSSPRKLHW